VQDEEARGRRKPRPQYKKEKVAPTKPKVKTLNGRHQPKRLKAINKAKGEKTKTKKTPTKASPTSSPPKNTKKGWRVKRVSSTSGSDESKTN
jgi:hypothetical protein